MIPEGPGRVCEGGGRGGWAHLVHSLMSRKRRDPLGALLVLMEGNRRQDRVE